MTPKYALLTLPKRVEEIHNRILAAYGLTREEVFVKGGSLYIVECRHVCIYVSMKFGMDSKQAAELVGLRCHQQGLLARDRINELTELDDVFANKLKELIDNGDC
jgi:chromosomal replication initiation ATPase DnaA